MKNIHDYLIEQGDRDWSSLLRPWAWLLPQAFTLWMVNRFGDLFLVLNDGSVHWLDIGSGTLNKVADSREHFYARFDEDGNATNWLMMPLVDALVEAGVRLEPGQIYGYRTLPFLGGEYAVANVVVKPLAAHYAESGPIHEKLKGFPDGSLLSSKVDA